MAASWNVADSLCPCPRAGAPAIATIKRRRGPTSAARRGRAIGPPRRGTTACTSVHIRGDLVYRSPHGPQTRGGGRRRARLPWRRGSSPPVPLSLRERGDEALVFESYDFARQNLIARPHRVHVACSHPLPDRRHRCPSAPTS